MKQILTIVLVLFITGISYAADEAEEITLTTYYPAPYGDYATLFADEIGINSSIVDGFNLDVGGATLSRTYIMDMAQNPDVSTDGITNYIWGMFPQESTGNLVIGYRNDNDPKPGLLNVVPFEIEWQAPAGSLFIESSGNVGIGTTSPATELHVDGVVTCDNINVNAGPLNVSYNGVQQLQLACTATDGLQAKIGVGESHTYIATNGYIDFRTSADMSTGSTPPSDYVMTLGSTGNLTVPGNITAGGNVVANRFYFTVGPGGWVPLADYVFEPTYNLESIEKHSDFMWKNKHLPAVKSAKQIEEEGNVMNIGENIIAILEELEKAHIYIEQLDKRLKEAEQKLAEKQ